MANVFESIDESLAAWIEAQHVFFLATAPLDADGLINLSPKGTAGTFRVLHEHTFAYLDITGSGVETVAHLRENGRICVMFCGFDGKPRIVRLHGKGVLLSPGTQEFDEAMVTFGTAGQERRRYLRGIISVQVERVSDSCGYAVPRMDLRAERTALDAVWQSRDDEKIADYHRDRNARSLDGLPGLPGQDRVEA
ncbi:MAG: pyridoxamine 5'-phosphate oxidase family protein [Ornithinimicrobium sp.]